MKDHLNKLLNEKSIMTLMLTIVFCILALKGTIAARDFQNIFTMIVGFYFGAQFVKEKKE